MGAPVIVSGVYEILNTVNGHRYIGSSNNVYRRWIRHKSDFRIGRHGNLHFERAWNLYGENKFIFVLIEECTAESLIEREQCYLDELHPEYNIRKIADRNIGVKHTAETLVKMSASKMGNKYGVNHSAETLAKMSAVHKGKPLSAEHKAKISAAHVGKKHTIETRKKMSESQYLHLSKACEQKELSI